MKRLNQTGALHLVLILIPIILVVIGFVFWRLYTGKPKTSNQTIVTCDSAAAKTIVTAEKLEPVHSCTRSTLDTKLGSFVLLSFNYGEGEDCPSGCITKTYTAMVAKDGSYHPYIKNELSVSTIAKLYGCVIPAGDAQAIANTYSSLVQAGKSYAWKTTFEDELLDDTYGNICVLNGTITSYFSDAVDKGKPQTVYALKARYPDINGCTTNSRPEDETVSCVSRLALLKDDPTLCDKSPVDVTNDAASTARSRRRDCITAVAGRTQETAVCDQLTTIAKAYATASQLQDDVNECARAINSLRTALGKPEQL